MIRFVYVSGPITSSGDRIRNIRAALDAAHELRRHGLHPFIPHVHDLWELVHPVEYGDWMRFDLAWLSRCDALLRLPGPSKGADMEVAEAERLSIPVFHRWTDIVVEQARREIAAREQEAAAS